MEIWDGVWDKLGKKRRLSRTQKKGCICNIPEWDDCLSPGTERPGRDQRIETFFCWFSCGIDCNPSRWLLGVQSVDREEGREWGPISTEEKPVGREEDLGLILRNWHRTGKTCTRNLCARQMTTNLIGGCALEHLAFLLALAYFLSWKYTLNKLFLVLVLLLSIWRSLFFFLALGHRTLKTSKGALLESGVWGQ